MWFSASHSMPRRGYRTQPRVSTLGTDPPKRRALKGRQIERTNHTKTRCQRLCLVRAILTPLIVLVLVLDRFPGYALSALRIFTLANPG
jgi:hypothetical protein